MEKNNGLVEMLKESLVAIPGVGYIGAHWRLSRGDVPLIFQSPNENGKANIEEIAEEDSDRDLYAFERFDLREKEFKIKKNIFLGYHSITSAAIAYSFFI